MGEVPLYAVLHPDNVVMVQRGEFWGPLDEFGNFLLGEHDPSYTPRLATLDFIRAWGKEGETQ